MTFNGFEPHRAHQRNQTLRPISRILPKSMSWHIDCRYPPLSGRAPTLLLSLMVDVAYPLVRHAISSATDHSRSRGVCFHRRGFVTGLGFPWHHGGSTLLQRCSRSDGRTSLKRNPGDSKGAWDNSAGGRRPTASRSRSARAETETKKLSDQITTLTERLDALQQSVANLPAASTHAATTGLQAKPR